MKWTRRHPLRELLNALRYVLSSLEGKHKPKGERGLSQLRVVTLLFAIAFVVYWPESWDTPTVTAMALILLAPSIDALLAKVPVAESVGAVEAVFGWLAARGQAGMAERVHDTWNRMPGQGHVPSPEDK